MSNRPQFGIIGCGRFGQLWLRCLLPFGEVKIFDQKISPQNPATKKQLKKISVPLREVVKVDMLFLLVPISQMKNICQKIAPLLAPKTVVIDACSVKVLPVQVMKSLLPKAQPIIATHPLFGPDSVKRLGIKNQKIVVSPVRSSRKQRGDFEKILKKIHLKIIHATPEEHDEQMARSQALVHFIGRGLSSLNLAEQMISTPDYQTLLRMNDMVHNDTWELFYDMQNANPYTRKIRKTFLNSLQKLNHGISQKKQKTPVRKRSSRKNRPGIGGS